MPPASWTEAEALLVPLYNPTGGFLPSPVPTVEGVAYVGGLHDDPDASMPNGDPIPSHRQEAWACAYLRGDFAENPAYAPPEGVVEIDEATFVAMRNTAFPPDM
jgi:hypothetical protein